MRKPFNLHIKTDRQRFYKTKEWRALRLYKLSNNPFCEECMKNGTLETATEVHHKVDLKDAPHLALDYNNLEALCKSCHSRYTIKELNKSKGIKILNQTFKFNQPKKYKL